MTNYKEENILFTLQVLTKLGIVFESNNNNIHIKVRAKNRYNLDIWPTTGRTKLTYPGGNWTEHHGVKGFLEACLVIANKAEF